MKKQYTKKQITEAIAYWKKQLKAGNYKKVNESKDKMFSKLEKELLDDFFSDMFSQDGELPTEYMIEEFKFKDDPTMQPSYDEQLEAYGPPSLTWPAAFFAEYAMDGRYVDELATALKKLEKIGYLKFNPKTGVVKIDTNHIQMIDASDPYGGGGIIIK